MWNGEVTGGRGGEERGLWVIRINSPEQWRVQERGEEVFACRLEWVDEGFRCDLWQKSVTENERKYVENCGETMLLV